MADNGGSLLPERGEARAMVDQMLELIIAMNAAERAKRELVVGTAEFMERAAEVERIARIAFRWSQMQLQMAERAAERRARGDLTDTVRLIDITPRPMDVVLSNWREAQLRLEISRPGSVEAQAAADDVERLREEYQATFEAVDVKATGRGDKGQAHNSSRIWRGGAGLGR